MSGAIPQHNDRPTTRRTRLSVSGWLGAIVLITMAALCFGSLRWTLAPASPGEPARFKAENLQATRAAPSWLEPEPATRTDERPSSRSWLGTDALGRDLLTRCLLGGAVSLSVGLAAALIAIVIGTTWGMIAGFVGGRVDAIMMRIVDVLYGLPYILLVVLLAVAADAIGDARLRRLEQSAQAQRQTLMAQAPADASAETLASLTMQAASRFPSPSETSRATINLITLLVAIGGVSWLTMARVVRGQTLSLRAQPFVQAAEALGASTPRILRVHILPNLLAPVIVYATLTIPQAILQESFLSFLGIGVRPPIPSWGSLAADGLPELNPVRSRWWLLLFPCLLLASTLLSLNFLGEALRDAFDPRSSRASSR